MDPVATLKTAFQGLRANKLRSFLTTLGVIIGVGTVISMVSIIEGMNRYVYKVLGSIGANVIYVQKYQWQIQIGGRRSRSEVREIAKRPDLTYEDAMAIMELPSVDLAAPVQPFWGNFQIRYRTRSLEVRQLSGTTPEYLAISGYELDRGRNLTEADVTFKRQVAILGDYHVKNLFNGENPLNKEVEIGNYKFLVIGTLKERGQILGNNLDDVVIIPFTTAQKLSSRLRRHLWMRAFMTTQIVVKGAEGVPLEQTMQDIETLLRVRRGLRFDQENNFAMNTQEMLLEAYRKLTGGIFLAMIGIASLALIVGGIGIMNIMLVSVTERTREIGIRMAVGAKRRDILLQFLLEAVALTSLGGMIGVLLGFTIARVVDALTPLPSAMPIWSVLLGFGFSAAVGLFFGIYPAQKAARLNPIEALRYE